MGWSLVDISPISTSNGDLGVFQEQASDTALMTATATATMEVV